MNTLAGPVKISKRRIIADEKEGQDLPLSSKDTVEIMDSNHQLTSSSLKKKRILNLFSIAGSEVRSIRNQAISLRETGIRFEEVLDVLRLEILKLLEE